MAIDFPSSPSLNQEYTYNGRVWKWLGESWVHIGLVQSALSVLGRASNTDGPAAAIVAANDYEVLRRSGTNIGFGTIATGGIGDSQVTYAKLQNASENRLLGRVSSGAGVVEEVILDLDTALAADSDDRVASQKAVKAYVDGKSTIGPNILINADGRITNAEWLTTAVADDTYAGPDRWYNLSQSNPVAASQGTGGPSGTPYHHRLTQSNASAQRMGRATIIENAETLQHRGSAVVLSGKIRCSSSQPIRYAILNWVGTADSVTSDVVLDWTSTTYTPNNFFINTTPFVVAVGSITPAANTWTDITAITGTVDTSANNLIVFIWTEGTAAQNVTLDHILKLERGSTATPIRESNIADEVIRCRRFAWVFLWTMEGYGSAFGNRIGTSCSIPAMRVTPSTTRISIGGSANIRGGDPATYVRTIGLSPTSVETDMEPNAAGHTSASSVRDRLHCEL